MKNFFQSIVPILAFTMAFFFAAEVKASELNDFEKDIFKRYASEPDNRESIRNEYFADVAKQVAEIQKNTPFAVSPQTRLDEVQIEGDTWIQDQFRNGRAAAQARRGLYRLCRSDRRIADLI